MTVPLALSSRALLDRLARALDEARRGPPSRPVVAFDADGTLWSGDVGDDLFEGLLARGQVRPQAFEALRKAASEHGVEEHPDPLSQARALYSAYQKGRLPDRLAFAMAAWVFAGHRADEVYTLAEEVLRERGIEGRFHRELHPVIDWARGEGVDVMVVSASPTAIVEQGVGRLSIPRRNVLAMRPVYEEGRVAPRVFEPIPYAEGKVAVLEQAVPDLHLVAAFGDNAFDAPLLRRAAVRVAVRAKPALLSLAGEIPELVALERA